MSKYFIVVYGVLSQNEQVIYNQSYVYALSDISAMRTQLRSCYFQITSKTRDMTQVTKQSTPPELFKLT